MWKLIVVVIILTATRLMSESREETSSFLSRGVNDEDVFDEPGKKVVNITDVLYHCLLRLQKCMRDPDNPYNIIPLDPFEFSLDQLVQRQTIQLTGSINGTVTGLSQYNIRYMLVAMATNSAKLWAILPQLSLTGSYNISGTAANVLPLYGAGPYSAEMKNISVEITTRMSGSQNSTNVTMTEFSVKFKPASVEVTLEGFLGGGFLGQLMEGFLQDSVLQFVNRARKLIIDDLRHTTTAAVNSRLVGYNISHVISFLTRFGNITDTC
uniref:Lipid-binding serum glycoprotein N-terminal domain-containing protein n=1 Tax=Graphocephala atropunctata TaxID=36148 RepID=A0A1B6LZX0_9HEMI